MSDDEDFIVLKVKIPFDKDGFLYLGDGTRIPKDVFLKALEDFEYTLEVKHNE